MNASNGHVHYHRNEQFGAKESLGRLIDSYTHIIKGSKERKHKLYKKIGISSSFAFMQPFTRNETGIP